MLAAIDQVGMLPSQILLTHGHLDHAGGATELQEMLQARLGRPVPIEGPDEQDRFLLDSLEQQAARFGFAGMRNVQPTRWLREGDSVDIAGHPFSVLHCPGHTPGHLVFVNPNLKLALVGDVLFQGSVGRTDFPYGHGGAAPVDPREIAAARQRRGVHLRSRPVIDDRRRAPQQSIPARDAERLMRAQAVLRMD